MEYSRYGGIDSSKKVNNLKGGKNIELLYCIVDV